MNLSPEDFEKLPAWREVKDWPGKVLGVVNKCNRGIAKANRELVRNGNPKAQFDVNKLTEFRVTVLARSESGQIKWHDKPKSGQISSECGQIKPESGQIKQAKPYDTDAQDHATLEVIRNKPGIKLEAIFLEIRTPTRSVRRVLERLSASGKIEYRGSKRTGGWFVKP